MNGSLSAKIIFKNGETCETSERNEFVAGETTLLSKGSLGDCSMRSFETENTISSILFKHRGADNWCFGGVEVKFDDRVRYGCPPGDEFELINFFRLTCMQLYGLTHFIVENIQGRLFSRKTSITIAIIKLYLHAKHHTCVIIYTVFELNTR